MEARPRSTRSPRRVILQLVLLSGAATFLFTERGGGVSLAAARRGGSGGSGSSGACAARARAAIVIVSYVPVGAAGEAGLAVFERSVASIARFWPAHEVEVFVADNNAADAGSGALLRSAVRRALGAASDEEAEAALRVHIVPNGDAAGGWRYVWGGVRAVVRSEGWRACVPFDYIVVLHHTMALLRPLAFPTDGGGAATEPFRAFLHFHPIHFDTAYGPQREWVLEAAAAAGVNGSEYLSCDGVFGPAWAMSRACLGHWLQQDVFERRVETKGFGMGCERLAGILAAALCGSCHGHSVDGDVELYPSLHRANFIASAEALGNRTLLKMWGKAD